MADVGGMFRGGVVESIVIKAIYDDSGVKTGTRKTIQYIKKLKNGTEEITTASGKGLKVMNKEIRKQRPMFKMWALSFMFAGMQIKRTADMITRASVGTYLKMTEGNTEASRSLIGLAANFKFLQFEIGNAIGTALKPLMPILTNLIRGAAQWVQQHPEATFIAIASAFTLGTGLFLGGQMILFANGITTMVKEAGGLDGIATSLGKIKDNFLPIAEKAAGAILISIGLSDIAQGLKDEDFAGTLYGALETAAGAMFFMGKTKGGFATIGAYFILRTFMDDEFQTNLSEIFSKVGRRVYAFGTGIAAMIKEIVLAPLNELRQGFAALKEGDYTGAAWHFGKAALAATSPLGAGLVSDPLAQFKSGFQSGFDAFNMAGSAAFIKDVTEAPGELLTSGSVTTDNFSNAILGGSGSSNGTTINANVLNILPPAGSTLNSNFVDIGSINRST